MKKLLYIICVLAFVYACETKETQPIDTPLSTEKEKLETEKPTKVYSTATQQKWSSYYNQHVDSFDMSNFEKSEKYKIERSKNVVEPIWSKDFDPIYKDFLIYNPDSTMYLDMDSYKWYIDDDGELHISADQALVLVNIPEKKAETLFVYGPSFWVEDAYFKNDSTIVIFENSTENIPSYQELNLYTDSTQYYDYNKALDFESAYLKNRINYLYKDQM